MVKHNLLTRVRRRSSTPRREFDTAESSEPFPTVSNSGFGSHRSNRARFRRASEIGPITNQPPSPPRRLNISDILTSATEPPSPICAMSTNELVHICPVPECECRKSLTAVRRSPQIPLRVSDLRIILLVTGVNSFAQLVYARLKERASPMGDVAFKIFQPGTKCTNGTAKLIAELVEWKTDIILCPFLTAKIPSELYQKFLTLVVHPGPPGDVGPSSLDWTLCGDDGLETDAAVAMEALRRDTLPAKSRSHWGCVVFQADEEMDKGPVWAWEQYPLPNEPITKGYLYHFGHSPAAWKALDAALSRVVGTAMEANFYVKKTMVHNDEPTEEQLDELCDEDLDNIHQTVDPQARIRVEEAPHASAEWACQIAPLPDWSTRPVSHDSDPDVIHLGGNLVHRPLIKPADRKVDWDRWTAEKIVQFVSAFDSQPGAAYHPKTASTKKLFIYDAHCQHNAAPGNTWQHLYKEWKDIPNGTAVAVRNGAVFFKTEPEGSDAIGVWITHGRVLRPVGAPIEPKISLENALMDAGHGDMLAKAVEWPLDWSHYSPGDWQEAYVNTQRHPLGYMKFVYWSFYNGAFTTEKCELLLRVLRWAGRTTDDHTVVALVLMGGHYFSNGIALNAIEQQGNAAPSVEDADHWAGDETWANINAIDDIVEYLAGDTDSNRSQMFQGKKTLCETGVTTIAVMRGNAAAGGVALAAACDIVVAAEDTVLNPAYRAMGLHGSEFHSWSYRTRCGDEMAATLLREMVPMTATAASKIGLVDLIYSRTPDDLMPPLKGPDDHAERTVALSIWPDLDVRCAPWCQNRQGNLARHTSILNICQNKVDYFARSRADFSLPSLVNFRTEELSQMLLDCYHPTRSQRYHSRRRAFIRKTKCGKTPSRYAPAIKGLIQDEEHSARFDATGPWVRGSEWKKFLGEPKPPMMKFSAWTRVVLFANEEQFLGIDVYRYEGPLTAFERMLQRVAICCSSDMTLDFDHLVEQLVAIAGPDSRNHLNISDAPLSNDSYTYDNWVWPQLGPLRRYFAAIDERDQERNAAARSITQAVSEAGSAVSETHQDSQPPSPSNLITASHESLQHLGAPSSSTGIDMSTALSSDTVIGTPPRLPFSRSVSPIPGESTHLGSMMLNELVNSVHVEPPKPQSRRYSRLNTGDPDLLSRAAGPSSRFQ